MGKNDYLVTLFLCMRDELLCPILNNPNALAAPSGHVVSQLSELKIAIDTAHSAASTKRASNFATKFINLCGADADRKYLRNERLPADEAKGSCLGCDHRSVDEPETNIAVIQCNIKNLPSVRVYDYKIWQNGIVEVPCLTQEGP